MIVASHGIIGSSIGQVDADYQAILDYATAQGYTLPSASQRLLQEQLVIDLKDAGIWSKLDTFAVFATDGNSDFALIDWKRLTQYTAVNSPTFTTNQGFQGDGVAAYIDCNFDSIINGINYTLNNASRYFYLKNSLSGPFDGVDANLRTRTSLGSATNHRITAGTQSLNTAFTYTSSVEFKSIHRISSTTVYLYNGKSQESRTQNSLVLENRQHILRSSSIYATHSVACYAMGASLLSENDDFIDAFENYLTSL